MPDKSCRTCGGDLVRLSTCSKCRKIMQKICKACNSRTVEEFHVHCVHLEPYQIVNSTSTIATVQSFSKPTNPKIRKKNSYKNYKNIILVISGIVAGIIILGMTGISNPESFSNPRTPQIQDRSQLEHPNVAQPEIPHVETAHPNIDIKYTYSNCLGISDGMHLTVTCPTGYGNVYKAVVEIPSDLVSQFENNIFNLRGISIIEHMDSISIQYAKKMYEAKFVNS